MSKKDDKATKEAMEFYNESLGATIFGGTVDYEAEGQKILDLILESKIVKCTDCGKEYPYKQFKNECPKCGNKISKMKNDSKDDIAKKVK